MFTTIAYYLWETARKNEQLSLKGTLAFWFCILLVLILDIGIIRLVYTSASYLGNLYY